MVWPPCKTVGQFLTKLNILLPYDPAITLLDIYTKELKIYVHTKTSTWIFVEALFITAKTWKQPRCPSVGEWKNKLCNCRLCNIFQCEKETSYQAMTRHGETLNVYC